MKSTLFAILTLLVVFAAQGQRTMSDKKYFDKDYNALADDAGAEYYRIVETTDGLFVVRDYNMNGQIIMESECTKTEPYLMKNGKTILYHENGKVKEESFYKDNGRTGAYKSYFENGTPARQLEYSGDQIIYEQVWSEEGKPQLQNGSGVIKHEDKNASLTYHLVIDASRAVKAYSTRSGSTDTVYTAIRSLPVYKGGHEGLARELKSLMRYPKSARRAGREGIVYISIMVTKEGTISGSKVIKGFDPECDAIALEAVTSLKHKWTPGFEEGRPANVRFALPLNFNLGR
jgi:TonB family protein